MATNQQAVLVFTDLVDSVKLQQHVGASVYRQLKVRHDTTLKSILASIPNAEIIESTGDGFYLRFATCSSAVEACLLFQHALAVDESFDHRLKSRIGIHCGEVCLDEMLANRLIGMAPNITARVMSLAMPGQILLTEPVYHDAIQYVRRHPPVSNDRQLTLRWVNHGMFQLKGDAFPISIFEVGAVGIAPLVTPPSSEKARHVRNVATKSHSSDNQRVDSPTRQWGKRIGLLTALVACALGGTMLLTRDDIQPSPGERSAQLPSADTPPEKPSSPQKAPEANSEQSSGDKGRTRPNPTPNGTNLVVDTRQDMEPRPESSNESIGDKALSDTPTAERVVEATTVPPQKYTIELARLTCEETNDYDDEDQIQFDLAVDEVPVRVKYPENYEGTPCANLSAGESWELGIRLTFEKQVEIVFRDLGGLPMRVGRTVINADTFEQGIESTEMHGRGGAKHRYKINWKLMNAPKPE